MKPNKKKKNIYGVHTSDFFFEDMKYVQTIECIFCKLVSIKNYFMVCNHCICEDCIKEKRKCPLDNVVITKDINTFNNELIIGELLEDKKIKCIFRDKGCEWIGIYKEFENKHINECIYKYNQPIIEIRNLKNEDEFEGKDERGQSDENEEESIFLNDFNDDINLENQLLNKKRNRSYKENKDERKSGIKNKNINHHTDNNIELHSYFNNILKLKNNLNTNLQYINNYEYHLSFYNNNYLSLDEIFLPEEEKGDKNNKISNNNYEISSSEEIYIEDEIIYEENFNHIALINSNLTLDIFPYYYYFDKPLKNSFKCIIKVISRNILKDNEKISFGLTNRYSKQFIEIFSSKSSSFVFYKGDILRITFNSKYFLIYYEDEKNNFKVVPFQNNKDFKFYPTIILNNKDDILLISYN